MCQKIVVLATADVRSSPADVSSVSTRRPAIDAEMNVTVDPAIIDLNAIDAKSDFLCGTRDPNAPNVMPIDAKFENPHKA